MFKKREITKTFVSRDVCKAFYHPLFSICSRMHCVSCHRFIGSGFRIFLLLTFIVLYGLIIARGLKSIYELRNRDSIRFSFYALGLTILFPFLMNLYTATSVLQSVSGGF